MLQRYALAVVLAALAALASVPASADWLTYGRDESHTGRVEETLPAPLAVLWKFASRPYYGLAQGTPATVNTGSPIVLGDTIYFASRDRLYAIDRTSGEMKWRYPTGTEAAASIRSTPVLSNGTLYVGANDGNLYAVDATTGSQRWSFRTTASIRSHPVVVGSSGSNPGLVVFGSDDDILYAIDAGTGELRWKYTGARGDIASAILYSSEDGMVYFAGSDMQIHAIVVATGRRKWVNRTPVSALNVSPVIYENRVYMPAGTSIYAFSMRNGSPTITPFVGPHELEADISTTPIITPDPEGPGGARSGLVYFGDRNGNFYCATLKGQRRWKVRLDARAMAMPVMTGDVLYVGTERGFVYGLSARDGAILWSYRSEAPRDYQVRYAYHNISAPLVADAGQLLVLGDDGTLTCFTADAVDASPPLISVPTPARGSRINGSPPLTMGAYIQDEGSGINPATVTVLLDGNPMEPSADPYYKRGSAAKTGVTYDPLRRRVEYTTAAGRTGERAQPLSPGRHTVKVQAMDWKGNLGELEWSFTVDPAAPKRPTRPAGSPAQPGLGPGMSGGPGGFPGTGTQGGRGRGGPRGPASRR